MARIYSINKQSDIRRFTHDMAKISAQKAEVVKNDFTFSTNSSLLYQRSEVNYPYHYRPAKENSLYIHRIRCPKCLREIGVKIGTNNCAWCDCQIEVDENYSFLD